MGNETILQLGKLHEVPDARLIVIAAQQHLLLLGESVSEVSDDIFKLVPMVGDQDLDPSIADGADVAIVEIDPRELRPLQRVDAIRARHPGTPIIVALASADLRTVRALVREGVADVISLPFQLEEVFQAAANCTLAGHPQGAAKRGAPSKRAPVIAVVRGLGGSGATTLATHLAAELGARNSQNGGACLIDLDIQFGSVCSMLNISPRRTLSDLLQAGERVDKEFLRTVAHRHEQNFSVVASPREITPIEQLETEDLLRLIGIARYSYDQVILDLPVNWTNWNLSAVAEADIVMMVVELNVASLHQAKRRLDLFASVGIDPARISIVVNKAERRLFKTIDMGDVERTLDAAVIAKITSDGQALAAAQDQGLLLHQTHRKSRFVSDVADLADVIESLVEKGGAQ